MPSFFIFCSFQNRMGFTEKAAQIDRKGYGFTEKAARTGREG
jgi:hypothetical protein